MNIALLLCMYIKKEQSQKADLSDQINQLPLLVQVQVLTGGGGGGGACTCSGLSDCVDFPSSLLPIARCRHSDYKV